MCASSVTDEQQGLPQVVYVTGEGGVGGAPQDGKLLWRFPWERGTEPNCATPIYGQGKLFVSSAHAGGGAVLQVGAGGVPQTVWKSAVMENQFTTAVLYQGYLYGFSSKRLRCVHFATGKKQWDNTGLV